MISSVECVILMMCFKGYAPTLTLQFSKVKERLFRLKMKDLTLQKKTFPTSS